ncbi:MAG: GNAT family N-acetyltransferase [Actinomycetota bacterium]
MAKRSNRQSDDEFVRRRTIETSLRDGSRVRVRPILSDDKQHLVEGFRRLSPESRYRRFMTPIQELTPEMLRHLTEVDHADHFAWIAFSAEEPGNPGVGVSRYVRFPDEHDVAEAAVTVVDDWHGRGLGTLLLQLLGASALENGIRRFRSYALEANKAVRDVLEPMGARFEHDSGGVVRVEVDLPGSAEQLVGTGVYEVLRRVARGEGPVIIPGAGLSGRSEGG